MYGAANTTERSEPASRAEAWWLHDFRPVGGPRRVIFYLGLFWLAWIGWKSPFNGFDLYQQSDGRMFQNYGLIELLGIGHLGNTVVRIILVMVGAAWIAAAAGVRGRTPAILTAVGVAFIHGLFLGTNAFNHNWFLPMYALAAMALVRPGRLSFDGLLRRRRAEPEPVPGVGDTGLPRKLVLVAAVGFYFSAGMSKVFTAGLNWLDGGTIHYFAAERGAELRLGPLFADNPEIAALGAVAAMFFEVGAPLALFFRRLRLIFYAGWIGMHLAIKLSMGPWYVENIFVILVVLVEWDEVKRLFSRAVAFLRRRPPAVAIRRPAAGPRPRMAPLATIVASASLALFLTVGLTEVFWWPLTNVYMYSPQFSIADDLRSGHPTADYLDPARAQQIATGFLQSGASNEEKEHMAFLAGLRLVDRSGGVRHLAEAPGVARWKQWILVHAGPAVLADLAAKPPGQIAWQPGESYPAQQFLEAYAEVFRDHAEPELLRQYDRLELTYPSHAGHVALAAVQLQP